MAEYIEREAALKEIENADYSLIADDAESLKADYLREIFENIPAADVATVTHGRWVFEAETLNTLSQTRCNICGWWTLDPSVDGAYNFCPHCGAKMDGGADND